MNRISRTSVWLLRVSRSRENLPSFPHSEENSRPPERRSLGRTYKLKTVGTRPRLRLLRLPAPAQTAPQQQPTTNPTPGRNGTFNHDAGGLELMSWGFPVWGNASPSICSHKICLEAKQNSKQQIPTTVIATNQHDALDPFDPLRPSRSGVVGRDHNH